ncbi:MAG: gamma-glutamyl-gamma-aminobutyrate hydrolase family protein [Oscillospiraceae bacterium]|nr:gamma-glutamyl-gamma-aminobutyrate hydrolase family protein [Oscillospiraceae bacterium]
MKPIIGIVTKPLTEYEYPNSLWIVDYIKDEFRDAVYSGGGLAIGLLPPFHTQKYGNKKSSDTLHDNLTEEEKSDLDAILQKCDGFILQGGLSGNYYEIYIAEYAIRNNIPIIGICAGFNTLARAVGCEMDSGESLGIAEKQHNIYSKDFRHKIDVVKDSVLYSIFQSETLNVNSLHIYFLKNHNTKLEINATATNLLENGSECTTIEAFTIKDTKFAMGIKWHPEIMDEQHKRMLFDRFLDECRK